MTEATTADGLCVGDCLLRLGDVHFAQSLDPERPPVVVAATRPPEPLTADPATASDLIEVVTSNGSYFTDPDTPAWVHRTAEVTNETILLISRRPALHEFMCAQGFPVQRRTPVTFDNTAHPVTATEWTRAGLIVVDGYLFVESILALWQRGDLTQRPGIVLLCTNPDDARTDHLAAAARADTTVVLPYDGTRMLDLLRAATGDTEARTRHADLFPDTP